MSRVSQSDFARTMHDGDGTGAGIFDDFATDDVDDRRAIAMHTAPLSS
jgi:hypothetical protein